MAEDPTALVDGVTIVPELAVVKIDILLSGGKLALGFIKRQRRLRLYIVTLKLLGRIILGLSGV